MSVTSDFYLARAEECARAASSTNLVNVSERYLRSEAAWREMAARILVAETSKRNALVDRATAVAAVD